MFRVVIALIIVWMTLAGIPVFAAKYDATQVVTARTKTEFEQQAAAVRKEMGAGGRYEFVGLTERVKVDKRLKEIETIFASYVEGSRLKDQLLVELLNAQEEVNAILTRRDGERLICTNAMPTGSHRPATNCKRYSDIERARRATTKFMADSMATPCGSLNCTGR